MIWKIFRSFVFLSFHLKVAIFIFALCFLGEKCRNIFRQWKYDRVKCIFSTLEYCQETLQIFWDEKDIDMTRGTVGPRFRRIYCSGHYIGSKTIAISPLSSPQGSILKLLNAKAGRGSLNFLINRVFFYGICRVFHTWTLPTIIILHNREPTVVNNKCIFNEGKNQGTRFRKSIKSLFKKVENSVISSLTIVYYK